MQETLAVVNGATLAAWLDNVVSFIKVLIGFSFIVFVHELGHFLAAKWVGIRVERFAVGFWWRLFGWRKGEGFTFGPRPSYTPTELEQKGLGETDYCFNLLPLGGYVKMMGEDNIDIDEKSGHLVSSDPRSFINKSVGARMIVVSAGVVFNIIFALFAYAAVYLGPGREVEAPVIGSIAPDYPAARAGMQPGDVIRRIDGRRIDSMRDVAVAQFLSGDVMTVEIERGGAPLDRPLTVTMDPAVSGMRELGVDGWYTTRIAQEIATADPGVKLLPGDSIVAAEGRPIESALDLAQAVKLGRGTTIAVTISRPGAGGAASQELNVRIPVYVSVQSAEPTAATREQRTDSEHILGLYRRTRVSYVDPAAPAKAAGFLAGDVIVQWGPVRNPRYREIVDVIAASADRDIAVVVERDGKPVELTVRPRRAFKLFGRASPQVGLGFAEGETAPPIVANTAPDTPAAEARLPRGALITSIDGAPVADWMEVVQALFAAAGRKVEIAYRFADQDGSAAMAVPSSIINELGLTQDAHIWSIDGQKKARLANGAEARLPDREAVRALLAERAGKKVRVEYAFGLNSTKLHEADFAVAADGSNVDPWQLRITRVVAVPWSKKTTNVNARGSLLEAARLSFKQTFGIVGETYLVLSQLTRSAAVQHVSGPVGIIAESINKAKTGMGDLVFFLAFLSVNLAVLNFLPLPVVDGGLMVFLILEKIRGRPMNVKIQMAVTVAGLVLIGGAFIFFTFQDIVRLWF